MKIELILFGVISIVLIVDFILRGIKKKDITEKGTEKFEGAFEENIKQSKFNYISSRKKNILTFIFLVMLVKPIFHYVFVEEKGEVSENVVNLGITKKLYFKSSNGELYKGYDYDSQYLSEKRFWDNYYKKEDAKLMGVEFVEDEQSEDAKNYYRDGLFNKNGDELFKNKDGEFFYFSRLNPTLKSYYTKYYKSKPYFFAISLSGLLILVFLFNDKIKAR